MPSPSGGAPQFRTDGLVFLSQQQENGIRSVVGVEVARLERESTRAGGSRRSWIK